MLGAAPAQAWQAAGTVEVKGNAEALRRDETASRITVGHAELVKFGDRSVLDVMKRLPGVTVSDGVLRMRGLGGYTQVLIDGEPAPSGFSLDALDPESIERIEVLRAATAEMGTRGIAGTVNIVLRRIQPRSATSLKASEQLAHGRRAPAANGEISGKRGSLAYKLGANVSYENSASDGASVTRTWQPSGALLESRTASSAYTNQTTRAGLDSRLTWLLGADESFTWHALGSGMRFHGGETTATTSWFGPDYPQPLLRGRYDGRISVLLTDASLRRRFDSDARVELSVRLSRARNDRSLHRRAWSGAGALVMDRDYASGLLDQRDSTTGKYTLPIESGHALAAGWDGERSSYRRDDVQIDLPLGHEPTFNLAARYGAAVSRFALYLQDEWEARPGWSLYAGARWEGVWSEAGAHYAVFSPILHSLWKLPGTKSQVRFALSRTYNPPTPYRMIEARFYTSVNSETSPDFSGNAALRPELAWGVDIAWEHYLAGGGMLSVSAAQRSIEDYIRNTVSLVDGRWLSRPLNQGGARVRNLELEARLPLASAGIPWPVEVRASASRNWSVLEGLPGPGNRLDRQPRWSANAGFDFKKDSVSVGASLALVAGGWTRTSATQWSYEGMKRDLECYVAVKSGGKGQWRFTGANLLAPATSNATRYADALGERLNESSAPTHRKFGAQYEYQFN